MAVSDSGTIKHDKTALKCLDAVYCGNELTHSLRFKSFHLYTTPLSLINDCHTFPRCLGRLTDQVQRLFHTLLSHTVKGCTPHRTDAVLMVRGWLWLRISQENVYWLKLCPPDQARIAHGQSVIGWTQTPHLLNKHHLWSLKRKLWLGVIGLDSRLGSCVWMNPWRGGWYECYGESWYISDELLLIVYGCHNAWIPTCLVKRVLS